LCLQWKLEALPLEALPREAPRLSAVLPDASGAVLPDEVPESNVAENSKSHKKEWTRWTRLAKAGNLSIAEWQELHRMGFSDLGAHLEPLPVMASEFWTYPWLTPNTVFR